ncbi:hypothetical protein evm_013698 [Chilo suppressalis]|nr:hypothetical protein evm_013698 [Chilo suppressalis]
MSKQKLFDDDSDEDIAIKTENEYAKKYDTWRGKEEMHKLEQKYGPDALLSGGSGTSDSEDESDEPLEDNEEMETQFLKTLALLKTKDPRIYDPDFKCFEEDTEKEPIKESKSKTLTFEDNDDDDDEDGEIFKIEKKAEIDDNTTVNTEGTGRSKKNKKEGKLKEYLTGRAEHIDDEVEKDLAPLKALWSDPKLNEGEAFLRDYILNKRYLDEDAGEAAEKVRDDTELEVDEQTVEEQAKFERAYNFRFEEPDEQYLKRYPRTMDYIRPKDDKRARKRAEIRARKEEQKTRQMEEIARLKALKLKEIQEKIAKIKEVTGNQDLAFKEEDIEGEFDPAEHDRRMKALFDEQFYGEADHAKPVFPDLDEDLEIENWDNYEEEKEHYQNEDEPHCEDDDFNMDADYDPKKSKKDLLEEIQKTLGKKRRNRKRQSKLSQLLATEKPKFLPLAAERSYAEHMEEYYKMDCEDIVAGMPTRFKYRQVVPNDYGLTVEEILLADDKELTQWVPLKRIVKYRTEAAERGDFALYQQRAQDGALKARLLPSLHRPLPQEPEIAVPLKETKKKKKKNKQKNVDEKNEIVESECKDEIENNGSTEQPDESVTNESNKESKKNKKKKKKLKFTTEQQDISNVAIDNSDEEKVEVVTDMHKAKKSKRKRKLENEDSIDNNLASKDYKKAKIENKLNSEESDLPCNSMTGEENIIEVKNKKKKHKNKLKNPQISYNEMNGECSVQNNFKIKSTEKLEEMEENDETHTKSNKIKVSIDKQKSKAQLNSKISNTNVRRDDKKFGKMKNSKKNKFNNKKNSKDSKTSNENPLGKLSDERLKAYGLNPKKYRGFLKYKKF